jgi:hypothetical protein
MRPRVRRQAISRLHTTLSSGISTALQARCECVMMWLGWRSSTAEQRFCKPPVGGSTPLASSTLLFKAIAQPVQACKPPGGFTLRNPAVSVEPCPILWALLRS